MKAKELVSALPLPHATISIQQYHHIHTAVPPYPYSSTVLYPYSSTTISIQQYHHIHTAVPLYPYSSTTISIHRLQTHCTNLCLMLISRPRFGYALLHKINSWQYLNLLLPTSLSFLSHTHPYTCTHTHTYPHTHTHTPHIPTPHTHTHTQVAIGLPSVCLALILLCVLLSALAHLKQSHNCKCGNSTTGYLTLPTPPSGVKEGLVVICSEATLENTRYSKGSLPRKDHPNEDRHFVTMGYGTAMFAVLDGHDGDRGVVHTLGAFQERSSQVDSHYHQDGDMASFLIEMFRVAEDGLFDELRDSIHERESLQAKIVPVSCASTGCIIYYVHCQYYVNLRV